MVRPLWLVLLTPVIVAVGLVPRAEAQPQPAAQELRLGVLGGMFKDVPPEVVTVVAQPFAALFQKQTGLNGKVVVVDDYRSLAKKLDDKDLEIGVFHGFEYAWVRNKYPQLQPLAVTMPPGGKVQALLVVNTASKAAKPADLKGDCVAVPKGTKAHCNVYLDRTRAANVGACGAVKMRFNSPDAALDAVADDEVEAALVDFAALTAYGMNKPGIFKLLKVLDESEPFPPAVVVARRGAVNAQVLKKIQDGLTGVKDTPEGKAFLFLWKLKGFEEVTPGYEALLDSTLKAYPPAPPK